jgi:haloalkane dehalogenase
MTLLRTIRRTAMVSALLAAMACQTSSSDPESGSSPPGRSHELRGFQGHWVQRGDHRIRAWEQPGDGPTIVLMHGFPDNRHLYDRLVPYLTDRHVVVFDFLGWGESDKPVDHDYTFANQAVDLDAVVTGLELDSVVLVPHDASGPPAINWALDHPQQVAAIVALNTFYSILPGVSPNPPEAIRLFSDPAFERLTQHFADSPEQFRWLYDFQVGGFIETPEVRAEFVPLLYRQFEDQPSTVGPFMELNADLNAAVLADTERHPELQTFPAPVRFAFGENDPYLSPAYGEALATLFPQGEATPITGAAHFPQLDAPAATAEHILTAPTT